MEKDMKLRVISGIVLFLLTAVAFVFGGPVLLVCLLLLSLGGMYEYCHTLSLGTEQPDGVKKVMYRPFAYSSLLLCLLYYVLIFILYEEGASLRFILYYLIGAAMLFMTGVTLLYPKRTVTDAALSLMGILYIPFFFSFLYFIRMAEGGAFYVWYALLASWGADTMAYYTGMFMGKHKLHPKLSPKKTIEGAVGGVVGALVLCTIYGLVIAESVGIESGIMLKISLLIGLLGSLSSIAGDLFASALKRQMKIKDFSNLIPGHGGILDRFDSALLVIPVVFVILELFQVIGA